jgi:phytoene dehydrogenase-like protein
MSSQPEYDAIVIGSGMGGLAFASIMAKLRKWRVLVLERHFNRSGGRVPLLRFPESLRSYQFASGDLVLEQRLGSGYPLGAKFFAHSFPCSAGNSDYIFCG